MSFRNVGSFPPGPRDRANLRSRLVTASVRFFGVLKGCIAVGKDHYETLPFRWPSRPTERQGRLLQKRGNGVDCGLWIVDLREVARIRNQLLGRTGNHAATNPGENGGK